MYKYKRFGLSKTFKNYTNSISILKLYLLNIYTNGTKFSLKNEFYGKFPNLNNISIIIKNRYLCVDSLYISEFNLGENNISPIKNIKIEVIDGINQIRLYCHSFKTLESIDLNLINFPIKEFFNNSNNLYINFIFLIYIILQKTI